MQEDKQTYKGMTTMRFRLGLMVGMGAGYVLGAKAGQERYNEIRDRFNTLMGTEPAQQLQAQAQDAAQRASTVISEKASEGVAKVSEKVGGGSSSSAISNGDPADVGIVLPPT